MICICYENLSTKWASGSDSSLILPLFLLGLRICVSIFLNRAVKTFYCRLRKTWAGPDDMSVGRAPSPDNDSCCIPSPCFCTLAKAFAIHNSRPQNNTSLAIFLVPQFLSLETRGAWQKGCHSIPLANGRGARPASFAELYCGHARWASQRHRPSAENLAGGSGVGGCLGPAEEEEEALEAGVRGTWGGGWSLA